jgi:hypothetical protein
VWTEITWIFFFLMCVLSSNYFWSFNDTVILSFLNTKHISSSCKISLLRHENASWVPLASNPSYLEPWDQDCSLRPAWANSLQDSISKNNQSKMDWRYGPSNRVLALQVQSPEFKAPPHQKKKKCRVKFLFY